MSAIRRAGTGIGRNRRDDADVVDDANVTNVVPEPQASGPEAEQMRAAPDQMPGAQSEQQRVWSMPKAPVTRKQADEVRRIALDAGTAAAGFIAGIARSVARALRQLSRTIEAVPPTVRLLTVLGVLILLGVVGAIAFSGGAMKRRAPRTSAASALTAAALPLRSVFAGVEVPAMGHSCKQVVLRSGDLEDLRGGLRGELLVLGQNGYEAARKN